MSCKSLIGAISSATLALFSAVVFAQQQTNPSQDKSGAGPMGRGVMMGHMMIQHQEMSQLMNKMMQSMTAINNEKDPAKLKALLAEHAALLDQMRTKMMGRGNMMQNMAGQVRNYPEMSDSGKPASK
jgi:hypothetical protein